MIRQLLLRALLLAGIATNIALLLINIRPERPHLSEVRKYTVLVRMSAQDAQWLQDNIISEFAAYHDLDIKVETVATFEGLADRLNAEAQHSTGVLLTNIDDERAEDLKAAGLIRPAAEGIAANQVSAMESEYLPRSIKEAHLGTPQLWLIPSRSEVDVGMYNATAVEDAFLNWEQDRKGIDEALREVNGQGLPKDYRLERAPDDWDSYDVFVAGWYWAHHPAPWAGPNHRGVEPRLVLRGGATDARLRDLLNSFYRHGATDADIAAGKTDTDAIVDALQWQALWVRYGLARTGKSGRGVEPEEMRELIKDAPFAWIPSSSEMSFRLHGGSRPGVEPGVPDPAQLAWAPINGGASVDLTNGSPSRTAPSYSLETLLFWAIPKSSPDALMALKLARFATGEGLAQREAEALGTLPVRNDIRRTYPILFRLSWMQDVFDASFTQLKQGTGLTPRAVADDHRDALYRSLQDQVVFTPISGPLNADAIRKRIHEAPHGQP